MYSSMCDGNCVTAMAVTQGRSKHLETGPDVNTV